MSTTTVITHEGSLGRGTYMHTCYNSTYCTLAGGIGDACGGRETFTPPCLTCGQTTTPCACEAVYREAELRGAFGPLTQPNGVTE